MLSGISRPSVAQFTSDFQIPQKNLWVVHQVENTVGIINLTQLTMVDSLPLPKGPYGLVFLPDDSKLFVGSSATDTVTAIDVKNRKPMSTLFSGRIPLQMVMKPDGGEIYVNNFDADSVAIINTATCELNGSFTVGKNPICGVISSDGNRLYIANHGSNTVSVLDPPNGRQVIASIAVGMRPETVTLTPDDLFLFVLEFRFKRCLGYSH